MTFQQKDKPSRQLSHAERLQQFQRPQYFQKGSTSSLDPLLANCNTGTSTPRNRPGSRATTVASFRTNAYASSTVSVSTRKSTVRKLQYSGFSSDSIATGPERLENLAKTLIARGSKLLKRQNSTADSASIRTVEWLGGSEGKMGKHKSQSSLLPGYGHERTNSTAGKSCVFSMCGLGDRHFYSRYESASTYLGALQFSALDSHPSKPVSNSAENQPQRARFGIFCYSCLTDPLSKSARHKG